MEVLEGILGENPNVMGSKHDKYQHIRFKIDKTVCYYIGKPKYVEEIVEASKNSAHIKAYGNWINKKTNFKVLEADINFIKTTLDMKIDLGKDYWTSYDEIFEH